jgi:hypothetical protein
MDTYLPKAWIYEVITRDKNDEYNRVEIVDNIVWNAVSHHSSTLRSQIVMYLNIFKTCF